MLATSLHRNRALSLPGLPSRCRQSGPGRTGSARRARGAGLPPRATIRDKEGPVCAQQISGALPALPPSPGRAEPCSWGPNPKSPKATQVSTVSRSNSCHVEGDLGRALQRPRRPVSPSLTRSAEPSWRGHTLGVRCPGGPATNGTGVLDSSARWLPAASEVQPDSLLCSPSLPPRKKFRSWEPAGRHQSAKQGMEESDGGLSLGFETDWPGLPWASYLTSRSLGFLLCKFG
nr:PREDICTED: uncharacterized protein LOC103558235 [Equus przewalskii]